MAQTDELEVLVPEPQTVALVNGHVYPLPAITWGKEIRVLRVVKDVMAALLKAGIFAPVRDETGTLVDRPQDETAALMTEFLLEQAPEKLTDAVAAICNQDKKWVEDNLNIEGVLGVVLPFLQTKQASIAGALNKMLQTGQTPAT